MAALVDRAVVVGGSMSGLLAATALADVAREVVLVDRDALPAAAEQRRGVPQGRHVHVLLSRGLEVLEAAFPGFVRQVTDRGGLLGDASGDTRVFAHGGRLVTASSGVPMLCASRPLLEAVTRERVLALDPVRVLDGTDVLGLAAEPGRVSGVRLRGRDGRVGELAAGLVVAATGRSAAPLRWLADLGCPAPREEEIVVGLTYVTRTFRRRPGDLGGALVAMRAPDGTSVRAGGVFAQEDDLWRVTLGGYLGERPPTDLEGFRAYAASLPLPEVGELVAAAEPVGEPATAHQPSSRRRRFEELDAAPDGLVVVGDAVCSFNPIYGQGMTVAAQESVILRRELEGGLEGLPRRFSRAAAKVVDVPWSLAAGGDLRFPQVVGPRPPQARLLNAYVARAFVAARHDAVVARTFTRVNNLLDPPAALFAPPVLARVLAGGSRRRPRIPDPRPTAAPTGTPDRAVRGSVRSTRPR